MAFTESFPSTCTARNSSCINLQNNSAWRFLYRWLFAIMNSWASNGIAILEAETSWSFRNLSYSGLKSCRGLTCHKHNLVSDDIWQCIIDSSTNLLCVPHFWRVVPCCHARSTWLHQQGRHQSGVKLQPPNYNNGTNWPQSTDISLSAVFISTDVIPRNMFVVHGPDPI